MPAINHLAGKTGDHAELLRGLTDEELDEQIKYYNRQAAEATGTTEWQWDKLASTAKGVQKARVTHE